jgi:hypothetical protein
MIAKATPCGSKMNAHVIRAIMSARAVRWLTIGDQLRNEKMRSSGIPKRSRMWVFFHCSSYFY